MLTFLAKELSHFRALPRKAQTLLISYMIKGASDSIVMVFMYAYIWQSNNNPLSVLFYKMGDFIALPIVFYINGLLLKKFRIQHLFFIGAISIGLSCFLVIFYTWFDPVAFLLYGALYGFGHGMYWANRNLLSLQETHSKVRNYFLAIDYASNFITSIVVPLIIGWFIALGVSNNLFTLKTSYMISMFVAMILLSIGGGIVGMSEFKTSLIQRVHVHTVTGSWMYMRILMIGMGIMEASTFFLPTILVMMYWGHEGILGTITSFTAFISAVGMYVFGRFADVHHRKGVFIVNMIFAFILSLVLAFFQNKWGVLLYVTTTAFTLNAAWIAAEPLMMDWLDEEHRKGEHEKYALVFDRELFLNVGRVITYLVCVLLYYFKGIGVAFLFMPLLAWSGLALISFYILPKIR